MRKCLSTACSVFLLASISTVSFGTSAMAVQAKCYVVVTPIICEGGECTVGGPSQTIEVPCPKG